LRRCDFSLKQGFYLAGLNGFFFEVIFSGFVFSNFVFAIIGLPMVVLIYGCVFIVPYLLTEKDFKQRQHASLLKKILLSFIPLVSYIFVIFWIFILEVFGLISLS